MPVSAGHAMTPDPSSAVIHRSLERNPPLPVRAHTLPHVPDVPAPLLVPFNQPHVTGREQELFGESLATGLLTGDGPFTARASGLLSRLVGDAPCLLTPSCTHALEMAALLLDLAPGDEVIVPAFTFVSVANAVAMRGAVPVFVDVRPDTFNLDERLVQAAVTPRTRAVVAVHYGGVACAMDELSAICDRHGISLIEDNAHGLGGSFRGSPLGSFGRLATQSFHATKNIQCGEGGALVVNDSMLLARAEILREKGTDRSRFHRGEVDKYVWRDLGSSYLLSDLLAAVLYAQLSDFDVIQRARHRIWNSYDGLLGEWRAEQQVEVQHVPEMCEHPAHVYALLMPSATDRDGLLRHLASRGAAGTFHYVPLDSSPGGRRFGVSAPGGCPVAADVASRLLRLPLFSQMTQSQLDLVIGAVMSYDTVCRE